MFLSLKKKMNATVLRFFFLIEESNLYVYSLFLLVKLNFLSKKEFLSLLVLMLLSYLMISNFQKSKRQADESPRPKGFDFLLISYLLLFPSQPSVATCDSCMIKFSGFRKEEATFGS